MQIIQIVPRLPPDVCGVGDYAVLLARELETRHRIESWFVVGDPACDPSGADASRASRVESRGASALERVLTHEVPPASTVVLHYVGFGYHGRGCPLWLVSGLERWRARAPGVRVVVVFHEVYPVGVPIWSTSFWLAPVQRWIPRRLARLADACITSREGFARMIEGLQEGQRGTISVLPVRSTIGEPDEAPLPLAHRDRTLVVFGSAVNRQRAYGEALPLLEAACSGLGITEILDIGPWEPPLDRVGRIPLRRLGVLPPAEVAAHLGSSLAGFLDYPADDLAKSTIFAAYCAYGMIPTCSGRQATPADGLLPDVHYWAVDDSASKLDLGTGQGIADRAREWYGQHRSEVQAAVFADLVAGPARPRGALALAPGAE